MFSKKQMLFIAAFALLGFVILAAAGSNADDARATTPASTTHSNGGDASLPDFDGDGTVGFGDFVEFAAKFGLSQGDDGYDARYDLNTDGAVGFGDFLIFAENFGKTQAGVGPKYSDVVKIGGSGTRENVRGLRISESVSTDYRLTAGQSFTFETTVENQGTDTASGQFQKLMGS